MLHVTGAGITWTDPTRKYSRDLTDVKDAAIRQKQLLRAGLELLAPQGSIVYSICSFHYQKMSKSWQKSSIR